MKATLKIKNNRYYAVINYKEGDKYKQKWITLGLDVKNNKRKAEAKLEEIKSTLTESDVQPDNILFVNFIRQWLSEKKPSIQLSTWEGYEIYAESHIIPYFEPLKLTVKDVKPKHIQDYYLYKYSSGRLDNKSGGLSIASLKKHGIVLKEVLGYAVLCEIIDKNPAVGVKLPGKNIISTNKRFLTAEEANNVLKAFENHPLQALVYVTLYYGLRRSEVLGLRWSAIDFEKNTLTINHAVVKNKTIIEKDSLKTQGSFHTYELIEDVKNVLLKKYNEKNENKRELGSHFNDNDYVFTWPDGTLYRPDYVTKTFQNVLRSKGIEPMRFHDLRHSTASILYDKGWGVKDIQMWLRHSSIDVTCDIYTHISEDRKAKLTADINSTFKI